MIEWWIAKWMLVAAVAMLALCAGLGLGRTMRRVARSLALMRRSVLAALVALAVVCVGVAQKPDRGGNGDDGRVERVERVEETQTPKHSNTQTLSPADIARGWRVESVTTNATFGYQGEYSNVVEKTEWNRRGGRDMRFGLDLGGFVFPLGSNEVARVCVLSGGTIWTLPPIAPRETICAAQEWASFQPGTSHFWSADAESGAKLLTWENVYANRDGTGQFSAQIELRESGDFVLRRDNVETVCRRINPDDYDGDGIPNCIDPNPLNWDGDCFGPANELPTDANSTAYCTVSIRVAGQDAEVVFAGDGPSNYPDPHFVAHGGVVYDVTILKGKTYYIGCRRPVSVVGSSDSETENWTDNDSGLLCVRRSVTATATSLSYFGDAESKRMFRMSVTPNCLDGVFDWTNSCGQISVYSSDIFRYAQCHGCTCGGCVAAGRYVYEGYGLGIVGGLCPCAFLGEEPQVEASVDPSPSVSAAFSQSAVIYENAYENTPGQWVGRRSTRTRLDICANGGLRGGTLSVAATNLVKLSKIIGAAPPTASMSVAPGDMVTYSAIYEALDHSAEPDDIMVAATFAENDTGALLASTSRVTSVQVELRAIYEAPENPCTNRHVYGVGEQVRFFIAPNESEATVAVTPDTGREAYYDQMLHSDARVYVCPPYSVPPNIAVNCRGVEYRPEMSVIEPQFVVCRGAGWNTPCLQPGEVGGTMLWLTNYVGPMTVSFHGIMVAEIPCDDEIPATGYFATYQGPKTHYSPFDVGASMAVQIREDNYWTVDQAGHPGIYENWSAGRMVWKIPIGWFRMRFDGDGYKIITAPEHKVYSDMSTRRLLIGNADDFYKQTFTISEDGTAGVEKHGHTMTRSRDCRIVLDGITVKTGH